MKSLPDNVVVVGAGRHAKVVMPTGPWSMAGAGAVCVVDVAGDTTVVGVPPRSVEADA